MVTLIWAQSTNGVIGRDGDLPWHLPEDLARFQRLTRGCAVVMGRRTWESLPVDRRPLAGRRNIVVTSRTISEPDVITVPDPFDAIVAAGGLPLRVIGGRGVYDAFMPVATRLEVTTVDVDVDGDTFAPPTTRWSPTVSEPWCVSSSGLRYRFESLQRERCAP